MADHLLGALPRLYDVMMKESHVNLSPKMSEHLARVMRDGGFDTPEAALEAVLADYVGDGDRAFDAWLKDTVLARYDAAQQGEAPSVTIAQARAVLQADLR